MSEDKEKVENLIKRVDELVVILNGIMDDLRQVSASLRSLAVSQITQPLTAPTPPAAPVPQPAMPEISERTKDIEDLKMMFPEDLESLLSFEEKEDYVMIKPRQYLGSENFAKIASVVREIGGEYVSAGKASHFRVPRKRA